AVSVVLFSSVLRTALVNYSITNPTEIFPVLGAPLATMRTQVGDETSVLSARAPDPARVRTTLEKQAGRKIQTLEGQLGDPDPKFDFTAVLYEGFVIIGRTNSVQSWLDVVRKVSSRSPGVHDLERLHTDGNAAITTFSDDTNRVHSFIVTLAAMNGIPLSQEQLDHLNIENEKARFSTTET